VEFPKTRCGSQAPKFAQAREKKMFPQKTSYDQAMRYLLTRYVALLYWLAGLSHSAYEFIEWLQTTVSIPGQKERIIDAVARIHDHSNNGIPTALLCESQTEPDFDIAARFMMGGAMLSLSLKPNRQVGDRYQLAALVINLTGNPNSARSCRVNARNLAEWTLNPIEVNLATFDATEVLQGIAKGEVPNVVLALIPLMKNGNDEANMQEWLRACEINASVKPSDQVIPRVFWDQTWRLTIKFTSSEVGQRRNGSPSAWRLQFGTSLRHAGRTTREMANLAQGVSHDRSTFRHRMEE
jgi:hypothetical protein